jgi:hypothetical protein
MPRITLNTEQKIIKICHFWVEKEIIRMSWKFPHMGKFCLPESN